MRPQPGPAVLVGERRGRCASSRRWPRGGRRRPRRRSSACSRRCPWPPWSCRCPATPMTITTSGLWSKVDLNGGKPLATAASIGVVDLIATSRRSCSPCCSSPPHRTAMALILRRAAVRAGAVPCDVSAWSWASTRGPAGGGRVRRARRRLGGRVAGLKVVGAGVLLYLGVARGARALAARGRDEEADGTPVRATGAGGRGSARARWCSWQPKAAVFMLAFYRSS